MPTPTYVPLATVTLASADASITFSSIPAEYRDLILIISGAVTASTVGATIRFNGDTGSNYTGVVAQGDGSSAVSGTLSGTFAEIGVLVTSQCNVICQIMDYSATDKHKTFLSRSNGAADRTRMTASRWADTSAITSVDVLTNLNQFAIGSTFSLYGIA